MFVNAWNEWAEGAYLEPDRRFGFGYLRATKHALSELLDGAASSETADGESAATWPPLYVVIHAFYPEILAHMLAQLRQSPATASLIVTCPPDRAEAVRAEIKGSKLGWNYQIITAENRGRDVLPFLEALRRTPMPPDAVVLKLHTKATRHRIDGEDWRRDLIDGLIEPKAIRRALDSFGHDPNLGLVAPGGFIVPLVRYIGENQPHIDALLRRAGWAPIDPERDVFAAGTMFFMRRSALDTILNLNLTAELFEEEAGQKDGTLAHAMERLFALSTVREGSKITDTDALRTGNQWRANSAFSFAVKTDYRYQSERS